MNKQEQKAKLKSGAERMLPSGSPLSSDIPHSSAAADILDMANYLFRGGEPKRNMDTVREVRPQNTEVKESARDTMLEEPEAIQNPFPQFFPNSYWQRGAGDEKRITGTANIRGVKYSVTAVRSNSKYPPHGIGHSVRKLRSNDGRLYWVGMTKL